MTYFVGAYWGPRKESRQACAQRMSTFLHGLAGQNVALSSWFKKAPSRKVSLVALPSNPDELALLMKANQRDLGGEAIAELGFNFSAWTGIDTSMAASLSATCGAYSSVVRNSVVVSFDVTVSPTVELLEGILKVVVSAFDPEDAVVNTTEQLSAYASLPVWKIPAMLRFRLGSGFTTD